MRITSTFIAVAVAVAGAALHSAAAVAQQQDCSDLASLTQADMNTCLLEEYRVADAELNLAYQAALANGFGALPDLLRDAQRAWIPFRDAACEADAELMRGGSGEPMMRLMCLIRVTDARTEDLRVFAEMN